MKKNKKMIVGFLAPAVIIFLIVFLYPIIRTIMMSMYKIESVTDTMEWWTFVGLGNYQKLFTTAIFKTAMMNILKIWALGGIIVLSVSLLFGVILTSGIRGKKFFRAIIYLPNIVSAVALATKSSPDDVNASIDFKKPAAEQFYKIAPLQFESCDKKVVFRPYIDFKKGEKYFIYFETGRKVE